MSKYLVVCTDGTWNSIKRSGGRLSSNNTNVAKIFHCIAETGKQIRYYDEGVGTGADVKSAGALKNTRELFDRLVGGVTGRGIETNIVQGYEFLAEHYEPGDKIIGFGFSRGAYTIRVLAGMVGRYGIPKNPAECGKVYRECYREKTEGCGYASHANVAVEFLGVWDTVGALGIPLGVFRRWFAGRYAFIDLNLGAHVRHAFHAVSVDEKRRPFRPALWAANKNPDANPDTNPDTKPDTYPSTTIAQKWFPGVHADVGGGYFDTGLSDVALGWMMENLARTVPALQWAHPLPLRIAPGVNGKLHESRGVLYMRSWLHPNHRTVDNAHKHSAVCERWSAKPAYRPKNVWCEK